MTIERISSGIMLDPSLILAERSIQKTFQTMRHLKKEDPRLKFYYPQSLLSMVNDKSFFREQLGGYFLFNAYPAERKEILMQLQENSNILSSFEVRSQDIGRYSAITKNLQSDLSYLEEPLDEYILNILIEEWVFLQEQSWIVSRIKKPFNRFLDAGSVCLQFSSRSVDRIVNRTLKRGNNELVSKVDRLRAFGKWVAVGGPTIIGEFINPAFFMISPLAAGYFMLFDPA